MCISKFIGIWATASNREWKDDKPGQGNQPLPMPLQK